MSLDTYSRWLPDDIYKLIDLVEQEEAIYNIRHKYYFCRSYVENFWRNVDLKLGKNTGSSLAKWTNLRISFRREHTSFLENKIAPCWAYYEKMRFLEPFLRKKNSAVKQRSSLTIDGSVQAQEAVEQLNQHRRQTESFKNRAIALNSNNFLVESESVDISSSGASDAGDTYERFNMEDFIEEDDGQNYDETTDTDIVEIKCETQEDISNDFERVVVQTIHPPGAASQIRYYDSKVAFKRSASTEETKSERSLLLKKPRVQELPPAEQQNQLPEANQELTQPKDGVSVSTTTSSHQSNIGQQNFCVCKTDPDAMFLMSLLPDIQSLTGRDRGRIKIEFQKIVQDFLYPS